MIESLKLHSKLPLEANFVQTEGHNQKAVKAALKVMDRHLSALNELDTLALASTLHFPLFRLVGTSLKVWETADRYLDDFKARAGEHWAYTRLPRSYQYLQPQIKFTRCSSKSLQCPRPTDCRFQINLGNH